jgi:hypothetical protein
MENTFIKWIGYDGAILGKDYNSERYVYSMALMIAIYLESTGDEEHDDDEDHDPVLEAIDFLSYNCWTAYVGEYTPIIVADYEFNLENEQE